MKKYKDYILEFSGNNNIKDTKPDMTIAGVPLWRSPGVRQMFGKKHWSLAKSPDRRRSKFTSEEIEKISRGLDNTILNYQFSTGYSGSNSFLLIYLDKEDELISKYIETAANSDYDL